MTARTLLVLEDGSEYIEAFRRGEIRPELSFAPARSFAEASVALERGGIGAVFIDVVFDRVPPGDLVGDLDALIDRYGGDRVRAVRFLSENQGFYLLDALATLLDGVPTMLAYDFDDEPERLASLRRRVAGLVGLPAGAAICEIPGLLFRSG